MKLLARKTDSKSCKSATERRVTGSNGPWRVQTRRDGFKRAV